MCGAGRFLFTVNIVHICQELCQTQSATLGSQLVFSGQIFDLEQNDKMTRRDCCQRGSESIFRLTEFNWEGGKGGNYQVDQ